MECKKERVSCRYSLVIYFLVILLMICVAPSDVDKKVSPISPLEGDEEEIKEGKGIKI